MRRDALIIGGGPAGAAVAITLARAGCNAVLVERASGPIDKVCGDFLSVDTIQRVRSLGADPERLGGVAIDRVRLTSGAHTCEIPLPFPALGLSRRTLDKAMLQSAARAGAIVMSGQTVRRLAREDQRWRAWIDDGVLMADAVFLATGKHDMRDLPRETAAGGSVGMKMYLRLAPDAVQRLMDATELFLFPGGYAGLQPVEDDRAVLCIAVRKPAFQAYGGSWQGLITAIERDSPRFAAMIRDASDLLARPLAVAGVPYGYLAGAPGVEGLFRVGDQAAVIPSLAGDGMAIACFSGQRAAEAWLAGADGDSYQRDLGRILGPQMRLAGWLHWVCQSPATQGHAVGLLGFFPSLLRYAARHTRLPNQRRISPRNVLSRLDTTRLGK